MEKVLTTSLTASQIRYLKEVLGVEQILWDPPKTYSSSEATLSAPRITVFVEKTDASERELFNKMITAMKLAPHDFEVIEDPTNEEYQKALAKGPLVSLVFGFDLASKLTIEFQRGKFANQNGIATVVTYGPADLTKNPELKAEAWKDMKLAMSRLGDA